MVAGPLMLIALIAHQPKNVRPDGERTGHQLKDNANKSVLYGPSETSRSYWNPISPPSAPTLIEAKSEDSNAVQATPMLPRIYEHCYQDAEPSIANINACSRSHIRT